MAPSAPARLASWRLDLVLIVLCFVAALVIRQPELQQIPQFTDEMVEIDGAWKIAADGERPLVSVDHYNGPLWIYLMAGGLALSSEDAELPRQLICLAGALTVALTYLLGRQVGGRLAGLVAALLLATNYVHIIINSHVAWSNSLTPLITTLAMLLAARAFGDGVGTGGAELSSGLNLTTPSSGTKDSAEDRSMARGGGARSRDGGKPAAPGWFLATAAATGLALQTHPTAVVVALAIALLGLWSSTGRRSLRTVYPYLSTALVLILVSNLIVFNLRTAGGGLTNAAERTYAYTGGSLGMEYITNVVHFGQGLVKMLSSGFDEELVLGAAAFAIWPLAIWAVLLLLALFLAWRAGARLPLVVLAVAWLVIPYLNQNYGSPVMSRYLSFLMPPIFSAVGAMVVWLRARVGAGGRLVLGLATTALVIYPLAFLATYYRGDEDLGRTNRPIWAAVETVKAAQPPSEVLIGRDLRSRSLRGGGHVYRALEMLLALDGVPNDGRRVEDIRDDLPSMTPPVFLVLTDADRDLLADRFALQAVDTGYEGPVVPGGWGLYRYD